MLSPQNKRLLDEKIGELKIPYNSNQHDQFSLYIIELQKWCQRSRLVSNDETRTLIEDHIVDSLTVVPFILHEPVESIVDIGSGAGFPGICVHIILPEISMSLIECRQIRVEFLRTLVRKLRLDNCGVMNLRLDIKTVKQSNLNNSFDVVLARGFAPLTELIPLGSHLLKQKGRMILHQGRLLESDLDKHIELLNKHKLSLVSIVTDSRPSMSHKTIMIIRKK